MIEHLKDLTSDPRNARKHTPRNVGAIVSALHEVGAARSIVIDEDGVVLAGNATIEAAAEAGITKVQVVDADGETVVAVRRSGLTPEQKVRLALFDNRAAELAEWDADVLKGLADEGALVGMFNEDELAKALSLVGEVDAPTLADGDKGDIEQMTFTLHRDQAITVRDAVDRAKAAGRGKSAINENSNGNALAAVCERYAGGA